MLMLVRFGFIPPKTHSPPWHRGHWVQIGLKTQMATIPWSLTRSEKPTPGKSRPAVTSLVPFAEGHSYRINRPMDNLITVVTRFPLPPGVTAEQIRAAFHEAAPRFRNVPGLVRKQFLRSKDCRTAGGV